MLGFQLKTITGEEGGFLPVPESKHSVYHKTFKQTCIFDPKWKVGFGKHRNLNWYQLVKTQSDYATWMVRDCTSNKFLPEARSFLARQLGIVKR